MRNIARCLGGLWVLLALYFLAIGWHRYTPQTTLPLPPLQNQQAKLIAEQLAATLKASQSQLAQALLLDTQTNRVEATVACRSAARGGGCGEDQSFLSSLWEPGSAFKPVLVASMLDSGYIQMNSQFSDNGYVIANGNRIDNDTGDLPATYTIEQFLGQSRNTGAVTILKTLGKNPSAMKVWQAQLEKLIPSEQGHVPDFNHVSDPLYRFYESSFGVGITITPLRLAQLYGAFQNNGAVCDQTNHCTQLFKLATATYMQQLLQRVATDYFSITSTDRRCVFGGKSGTALVAQPTGTYFENTSDGTYVGMITDQLERHNTILLIRLTEPNDDLASRPARLAWAPTANKLCQNL